MPFDHIQPSASRTPREGHHLLAPAEREGRLPEPRDRRDPRADGLHGRPPLDDRLGHLHHQRHRARRRHPARALAGRLRDGAEGPREAGLHREPDALARLLGRARDRQEGPRLRPHRPQAQAAGHDAAARARLQRDVANLFRHPEDPRARRQPVHPDDPGQGRHRGRTPQTGDRRASRRWRSRRPDQEAGQGAEDAPPTSAPRSRRSRDAREEARRPLRRHHAARLIEVFKKQRPASPRRSTTRGPGRARSSSTPSATT